MNKLMSAAPPARYDVHMIQVCPLPPLLQRAMCLLFTLCGVCTADTLDIVRTGGDGIGSCVLAAAAGAHVAKHGDRAVSSSCGAADVLL